MLFIDITSSCSHTIMAEYTIAKMILTEFQYLAKGKTNSYHPFGTYYFLQNQKVVPIPLASKILTLLKGINVDDEAHLMKSIQDHSMKQYMLALDFVVPTTSELSTESSLSIMESGKAPTAAKATGMNAPIRPCKYSQ